MRMVDVEFGLLITWHVSIEESSNASMLVGGLLGPFQICSGVSEIQIQNTNTKMFI